MKETNYKQIAREFLFQTSKGNSREIFNKYVGQNFKHHNIYFNGDAETLIVAMEENAKIMPDMVLEVKNILCDDNLVAVHSHVKIKPDDAGIALMHIFRFEADKIVELWDFGQAVPNETVNENGMF